MGWRTDFKKTIIEEMWAIDNIGYVGSKWTQAPIELPALIISLADEEYERTLGMSIGTATLRFEIQGRVKDLDDPDEAKEDLLDKVIERLEAITGYDVIIESTDFHDHIEGGGPMFTLMVHLGPKAKDFSDM